MQAIVKTQYAQVSAYQTKDGSEIRELMHPSLHGNQRQSLAEAIVAPGARTRLHRHGQSEELYHITRGLGVMTLGDAVFEVRSGDTIAIPPGTAHRIENTGKEPLHILCACSPPYSHEDTEILNQD